MNASFTYSQKQSRQISVKAYRPSIKGSKLLLKVIKAIIIIHVNASHTCAPPNLVVNTNASFTYSQKQSRQISVKAYRPSIKGSKLLLKLIKAIVSIHVNASHTCASPNLVVNTNALITYSQKQSRQISVKAYRPSIKGSKLLLRQSKQSSSFT